MAFICEHCKGEFDDNCAIKDGDNHSFCCNGCKNVYAFLRSNGLDEFYEMLGKNKLEKAKDGHFSEQSAASIFSKLIKRDPQKPYICELSVLIAGIHCPACVWLNEKSLSQMNGVLEIEISATTNKARILFDERSVSLSDILNRIVAIGYTPKPYVARNSSFSSLGREYYAKLIVAVACSMNIMWVAVALYSGYFSGMSEANKKLLHFAEFILASAPVFYTGSVFFKSAIAGLKARQITMDFNISLGVLGVYFYSVYAMLTHSGEVYFDSACMLVTFIFAGKFLQNLASAKAALGLEGISSLFVSNVYSSKDGKNFDFCDVSQVEKDDFVMLRAGERAMIDGILVSGALSVDNSSISGESLPVGLGVGQGITSGALCVDGNAIYRANNTFEGSFLSRLAGILSSATFAKPYIEQKANEISSRFSAVIFALFVGTFVYWSFFGSGDFRLNASALGIAISVLVIACPCALSLATPIATLVALGAAFKKSVIFKDARMIESLAKCDIIAFDKTGTLSLAKLKVTSADIKENCDKNALFSLLSSSAHPVSNAVMEFLKEKEVRILDLKDVKSIAGRGVKALCAGRQIAGGSREFVSEFCADFKCDYENSTTYYFCEDGKVTASFALSDELRNDAKSAVCALKDMGLKVVMLSGDKEQIAKNVGAKLGIDNVFGALNPFEKANIIKELRKNGAVAMIGDGINDIAALQAANVGICMGSGASVSVERSDVVLLRDELESLVFSVRLARRTFGVIKENLALSLVYNALSIPLAMAGYVIPLIAAISMSASSLIVILNSLKLRGQK